ncbi:MAG: hypothetical protein B6I31_00010 [Desulfobacteraceae bacterium 4572_19]|nr:MAG: hypothetical protein B6I31_00010 [Desulfobacteraceae bacterium 4572_19]
MRNRQLEKKLLQEPAETYLKLKNIEYIHIVSNITRMINKRFYNFSIPDNKDFPDLIIFFNGGITLFIEFKIGKNKLQKGQVIKKNKLENAGFDYYVVYDIDTFIDIVNRLID